MPDFEHLEADEESGKINKPEGKLIKLHLYANGKKSSVVGGACAVSGH